MGKTPFITENFVVYNNDGELLGAAEVTLPDLEYMTETITGSGIAGELEIPLPGQYKAMEVGLKFPALSESIIALAAPISHQLDIRGSIRGRDPASGELVSYPLKVVVKGPNKKAGLGKLEAAKAMENEFTIAANYLKIWIDNREKVEIDIINMIAVIDGVDYMARTRENLGKSSSLFNSVSDLF